MFLTPSAWAPSNSDSRAIKLRSRVVKCTTHSRSRSCWMPNATASAPMRTRAVDVDGLAHGADVFGRRAAAATDYLCARVQEPGYLTREVIGTCGVDELAPDPLGEPGVGHDRARQTC